MRTLLLCLTLLALAACQTRNALPYQPKATPKVVPVYIPTYVEIDKELTKRCAWVRSAPLEKIPSVARGRKACLEFYESNLGAIELIEGQPVPDEEKKK